MGNKECCRRDCVERIGLYLKCGKLLRVLCENRGKVLKREYLIDEVWQGDTEFVDAHALTVAVKRLRDKLEDDTQKPEYIKTVYGIGYTWAVNG